ncbi:hypothetical protein, partial [Alistipes ihumii]|uniref:hypothetical protein n=1 Tax=Alistipes ihumii TaxID=1470347 RepID=UPI003AB559D3
LPVYNSCMHTHFITYSKGIESPEEKAKFVAEKEKEYNDKFSNPYNAARCAYFGVPASGGDYRVCYQ